MTISITEYINTGTGNNVNPNPTVTNSMFNVISSSATSVTGMVSYQGMVVSITAIGSFDTSKFGSNIKTFQDFINVGGALASTIDEADIYISGVLTEVDKFSPGVTLQLQSDSATSIWSANNLYKGAEVFTTTTGASAGDNFYGYAGYATFYENHTPGSSHSDYFVGGTGGLNTLVLPGSNAAYTFTDNSAIWNQNTGANDLSGYSVASISGPTKPLTYISSVQRVSFGDGNALAFDTGANQTAGNAYLLYQAAFNRTPDTPGLGYWIAQMDKGANVITGVAENFILSNEFKGLYGSSPTVDQFTNLLYVNVLHRSADAAGLKYWEDQFAGTGFNLLTQAQTLNNFAISNENQANAATQIAHGIHYQAYVG